MPNATATGGSTGTDLNGKAVINACRQIVQHLRPFRLIWPKIILFKCILDNQGRKPKCFLGRNNWESLPDENSTCCLWILQHFSTRIRVCYIWVCYDMSIHSSENMSMWKQQSTIEICSPDTNTGSVFNYLTNGVGCSLVELNCLTGAFKVLRSNVCKAESNLICFMHVFPF